MAFLECGCVKGRRGGGGVTRVVYYYHHHYYLFVKIDESLQL